MKTPEHIEQCFTDIQDYIEELKETITSLGHLNKTISSTAQKSIRELESRLAQVEKERDAAVRAISIAQHYIKDLGALQYGLQQLENWDYYLKEDAKNE